MEIAVYFRIVKSYSCVLGRRRVNYFGKMASTIQQQGGLLDVLKKKMRQTKEEMEKYKDECEELQKKLHLEIMRREEVRETK